MNAINNMQRAFRLLLAASFCCLFFSCDKMECNDGLDGQWQMCEWKSPEGEVVAGKEMKLYYSFQLQMMMFQRLSSSSGYLLSSFENRKGEIRVYDPIKYAGSGHDDILPMDTLAFYGVPLDGVMKVEQLSGSTLVLSSREQGTLTFRKY